jgi:hypothetical protein
LIDNWGKDEEKKTKNVSCLLASPKDFIIFPFCINQHCRFVPSCAMKAHHPTNFQSSRNLVSPLINVVQHFFTLIIVIIYHAKLEKPSL